MEQTKVSELFDEQFKYQINQDLRHRGDKKGYAADMGLLVLHRLMYESTDDDGNKLYERAYICRLVKFSGSGETAQFREKELITTEEYERQSLQQEIDRNAMRNDARATQKEVYAAFGVSDGDFLRLKDSEGKIIEDKKYRVTGFSMIGDVVKLGVTECLISLDKKVERDTKELTSVEQFEIIK